MDVRAKVYEPRIQVLIHKNVGRTTTDGGEPVSERYKGSKRVIDLSRWLGEGCVVRTSKSTRDPAGGFTITLSDRIHPDDLDTLYGLIEPMDLVEIRMAHEPGKLLSSGNKLPIIMRGFVSKIARPESMGSNGQPSRQVVISGQDYGKIWQILQIFYMPNYTAGENLITQFKLFAQYGVGYGVVPAKQFLKDVIQQVINPFLNDMKGQGEAGTNPDTSPLVGISIDDADIQTGDGIVAPFGLSNFSGPVFSLLAQYLDVGPFSELFLEDRENGVNVVYRQNPFYKLNGDKIAEYNDKSGFTDPKVITVGAEDVVAVTDSRSDENVANYYWVNSPRHEIAYGPILKLAAAQGDNFYLENHRNSNPKIYGIRKMEHDTQQGAPDEKYNGNGIPKKDHAEQEILSGSWINDRRKQLVEQNKDNVVFESSTMRLRGREDIRPGVYIRFKRGSFTAKYYVVAVDHEFVPFSGFWTNLTLERGTGFAERIKAGGKSPYYQELT